MNLRAVRLMLGQAGLAAATSCYSPNVPAELAESGTTATTTGDAQTSSDTPTSSNATTGPDASETDTTGPSATDDGTTSGTASTAETSTGAESSDDTSTGAPVEPSLVVFLNFEGPTLVAGAVDDAPNDVTAVEPAGGVNFEEYANDADEADLLARVQEDYAAFNVLITSDRPASGDYTMVVVSPTDVYGPAILGISSLNDCGNANPNSVSFAFFGAATPYSLETQANMISSQIAISLGLERTNDDSQHDIMHQMLGSDDREFIDLCIELAFGEAQCPRLHDAICGDTSRQNSVQELTELLGPAP